MSGNLLISQVPVVEPSHWLDRGSAAVSAYDLVKVGLEMQLIAVVVYTTLRFLQGTRGARLMRAIGLIVVVSFLVVRLIAVKLELDRINYLYPYFLGAVFLITLIVFQTELRRGLLILGANWWSRAPLIVGGFLIAFPQWLLTCIGFALCAIGIAIALFIKRGIKTATTV